MEDRHSRTQSQDVTSPLDQLQRENGYTSHASGEPERRASIASITSSTGGGILDSFRLSKLVHLNISDVSLDSSVRQSSSVSKRPSGNEEHGFDSGPHRIRNILEDSGLDSRYSTGYRSPAASARQPQYAHQPSIQSLRGISRDLPKAPKDSPKDTQKSRGLKGFMSHRDKSSKKSATVEPASPTPKSFEPRIKLDKEIPDYISIPSKAQVKESKQRQQLPSSPSSAPSTPGLPGKRGKRYSQEFGRPAHARVASPSSRPHDGEFRFLEEQPGDRRFPESSFGAAAASPGIRIVNRTPDGARNKERVNESQPRQVVTMKPCDDESLEIGQSQGTRSSIDSFTSEPLSSPRLQMEPEFSQKQHPWDIRIASGSQSQASLDKSQRVNSGFTNGLLRVDHNQSFDDEVRVRPHRSPSGSRSIDLNANGRPSLSPSQRSFSADPVHLRSASADISLTSSNTDNSRIEEQLLPPRTIVQSPEFVSSPGSVYSDVESTTGGKSNGRTVTFKPPNPQEIDDVTQSRLSNASQRQTETQGGARSRSHNRSAIAASLLSKPRSQSPKKDARQPQYFFPLPNSTQQNLGRHNHSSSQASLSSNHGGLLIPPLLSNNHSPQQQSKSTAAIRKPPSEEKKSMADMSLEEHVSLGISLHEAGDLRASTYHWQYAADKDNKTAMLLYGLALRHGWGIRKNPGEAVRWLQRAMMDVEIGDKNLSTTYRNSVLSNTESRLQKAQIALALYELGMSYLNCWGLEKDEDMALKSFEMAGDLGDTDALCEAAAMYTRSGPGRKKDLYRAAQLYRQAGDLGVNMVGNSWIYKDKYMEKDGKGRKKEKKK